MCPQNCVLIATNFVLNYLGQLKFGRQQNKHHFWLIYMSVIIVKWFAS